MTLVSLLRVGGRLSHAKLHLGAKYPVILPKSGHITNLVVRHFHEKVGHQDRGITSNEIRDHSFWLVGLSSVVTRLISACITCSCLQGYSQVQKMSDLPEDRVEPAHLSPIVVLTNLDHFTSAKEGKRVKMLWGYLYLFKLYSHSSRNSHFFNNRFIP